METTSYHSRPEAEDNCLGKDLAADLAEVEASDEVEGLVAAAVAVVVAAADLAKGVRGQDCPDREGWPLCHQIGCSGHDQWQEEQVARHHRVVVDHSHPRVMGGLREPQSHDATEQCPLHIWCEDVSDGDRLAWS